MPEQNRLTHDHLETFVFDPHRAAESDIQDMARMLIEARNRIAELEANPIGFVVLAERRQPDDVGHRYNEVGALRPDRASIEKERAAWQKHAIGVATLIGVEYVIGEIRVARNA